ncbi:MAG: carotenoid oxygenase family protein [Halioglobus sp.]|nr:carotenoid oxygenase family protein [Halioglobus sp.]
MTFSTRRTCRGNDNSAFCLFDATDMSAGPIARVQLPVRVPIGFHGVWLPDSALT